MTPAGLGWRTGARLVDVALVAWLAAVITVEIEGRLFGADPFEGAGFRFRLVVVLIVLATEVLPVGIAGASLGKAVFALRVVPVDNGEQRAAAPGVVRALLRSVALYGAILLPLAGGLVAALVVAPVFVAPARRGLHDRLAGTMVVALDRGRHDGQPPAH